MRSSDTLVSDPVLFPSNNPPDVTTTSSSVTDEVLNSRLNVSV